MGKTAFRVFFVSFFAVLTTQVFAQADLSATKQASRRIIYAVKPVEAIAAVPSIDDLYDYVVYAQVSRLPSRKNDPNVLNEADSLLLEYLATFEIKRRELSSDDFSLYLQDIDEQIYPLMMKSGNLSNTYIKIDTWIDLFRLNLMAAN